MVIPFEIEETIGTTERAAQGIVRRPYGKQIGEKARNRKAGDGNSSPLRVRSATPTATSHGIAAMQSINVVVLNRWFLGAFLGTAILCAVAMIGAILRWQMPNAIYLVVGGALYLVGSLLVTIVFNVPKNESLAALAPDGPRGADAWARYVSDWTAWNHVRTAASLAAAASLSLGLAA